MKTVTILLIDDHSVVTEGVKAILRKRSEFVVAGEAKNALEGIELAQSLKPHLIITDICMPQMSGIEAVQKIRQFLPNVRSIVLSAHFTVLSVRDAVRAEVAGLVDKQTAVEDLMDAVDCVLAGKQFFSLNVRHLIASDMQQILCEGKPSARSGLTGDEVEMVRMLSEGNSIVEIAKIVNKSPKTIDAKRRRIMSKLGFESIAKLTKYAVNQGITSLEC